jgi:hypothetical protein
MKGRRAMKKIVYKQRRKLAMRMNCTSEGRRFSNRRNICCLYKTNQLLSSKSGMQ